MKNKSLKIIKYLAYSFVIAIIPICALITYQKIDVINAWIVQLLLTIHIIVYVYLPYIKTDIKKKKIIKTILITRVIITYFLAMYIPGIISFIDIISVLIIDTKIFFTNLYDEEKILYNQIENEDIQPVQEEIKCTKCGKIIRIGNKYCNNCGNPVNNKK